MKWNVDACDVVTVVGTEGPSKFPLVYGPPRNITVVPFVESQALRIGAPKKDSQSQPKGSSTVSQTFIPSKSELRLPLRLFSFEHRGDDHVIVDVIDGVDYRRRFTVSAENPNVPFTFPGLIDIDHDNDTTCTRTPCNLEVEGGATGALIDSNWQVMVIRGLPTDHKVTLKVTLQTKNNGHPSWLYVDGEKPNRAPVANFSFNPSASDSPLEGDFVAFSCTSSTDPDNDPLTCTWHATGAGLDLTAVGPLAFFVFPDDGAISMTLTVSDGKLTNATTKSVLIKNGAPIVSTLELVEVPVGGKGSALCRFLDPGVQDTHDVTFDLPEGAVAGPVDVQEEHDPSLSSGFGRAPFDVGSLAPGLHGGECTVTDNGGAATTRAFQISVLTPAEVAARESIDTDTSVNAPSLKAARTILTALEGGIDVDVFQILPRVGGTIPVGAEVGISVDVPADYDAILLSRNANSSSTPFVNAPFVNAPFVNAPFVNVPFVNVPFVNAPFVNVPFVNVPFVNAPFVSAPFVSAPFLNAPFVNSPFLNAHFQFEDFPLSQVGLAAPDGGQISGADIGLGELGSYNLGALQQQSLGVKALSAQLGTNTERMLVRVGPGEDALFLALVSHAGIVSPAAASITVEMATPPSQRKLLGANCDGVPLVPSAAPGTVLYDAGAPLTLIFTQQQRFQATWKQSDAEFNAWLLAMKPFFDNPSIRARVISLPSAIYNPADIDTCDIPKQNEVARQIRAIVRAELAANPSVHYLQIIGGPDIVPVYFSPDETTISYEGLYAQELYMLPGKPLAVALAEGYNPTDAYYADLNPQPFRGRELYIEDLPLGRLGESPAEVLDAAMTFIGPTGNNRPITSALVTGYDFFADGADATANVLGGITAVTSLISNNWTAEDLRCELLGKGTCNVPDLTALNAHMSYNALLSAYDFANPNLPPDALASTESTGLLAGRTTLSIGCHSGLNFPDAWAIPQLLAGLTFDPGRDWTQEAGTWVGPWTYGIGDDTVADRGTEGIMTLVTEELRKGRTLGDALVRAKQRYASGLFEFGVYDEKSLIGLGLFGMPQSTYAIAPTFAASTFAALSGISVGNLALELLEQGNTSTFNYSIERQDNTRGDWFTLDGDAQAVFGRPLLPSAKPIEARSAAGHTSIHGVALRGGHFTDYQDFDPVFPTPRHDWTASVDEPQPCVETLSPTQLSLVSALQVGGAPLETLIVQSGQFRCTQAASVDQGLTGQMRIFDQLKLEALHPTNATFDGDFEPPTVSNQNVTASALNNDVSAVLDVTDRTSNTIPASGMREIIALIYSDTDGTVTAPLSFVITPSMLPPYRLTLPNAKGKQLSFQYIDNAGNLLQKSLKGALITALNVNILTTQIVSSGPTQLKVFVGGYEGLTGVSLEIDFGDGTAPQVFDPTALPPGQVVLSPEGCATNPDVVCDATVTISHDYSGANNGTPITVVVTVRADGAIGTATAVLTSCGDPAGDATPNADIVGCAFTSTGTKVQIDLEVKGVIANGIFYKVVVKGQLFIYVDGHVFSPWGIPLQVTKLNSKRLRFAFDAKKLGWNGRTPFEYKERTVSAWFPFRTLDETVTLKGYPVLP